MARFGAWLWDGLIALLGATLDQILEFPACLLLGGVITRRGRGAPVDFFDVGSLLLVAVLVAVLVRRVVRFEGRSVAGWGKWAKVPAGTEAPTASLWHLVWGGAYLWLASGLWTINDAELQRQYYGVGPGFAIVAGGLLLLRASYWLARR